MTKPMTVPNVSRRPAWAGAFTLVEILVVVLIIGIAAAVIVPIMGSRDDLKVKSAARLLMADLIYAQNRAISTQQRHYVIFNETAPQNYRLTTSVTPIVNIEHPVTHDSQYAVTFGPGGTSGLEQITIDTVNFEGKKILSFDELGVPSYYDAATNSNTALSTSGGNYVDLLCGSQKMRVLVEPFTGELLIQ